MIRVLSLRSQKGDFQTEQTAALLQNGAAEGLSIKTSRIGAGADHRHSISAALALRSEQFDILHVWDTPGLGAAVIAGNTSILYSPSEFPTQGLMRCLNLASRFRAVQIVSANAAQHRAFEVAGFLPQRAILIRPGVKRPILATGQRTSLRRSLGYCDDDHLLLCPGESTRAANHELAIWVASILHVHDARHKVLLWGRGSQAEKTYRLGVRLHQHDVCRLAEAKLGRAIEFSELTAAADTVLHTGTTKCSSYSLAVCMAAGLPIIAVASAAVADILRDQRNAIVMPTPAARSLAQRILELREEPDLRRSIAERARKDAEELFSPTRCLDQYRALYLGS